VERVFRPRLGGPVKARPHITTHVNSGVSPELRGRWTKADRVEAKAEEHSGPGGGTDGPPYAAAVAMPRPRRFILTDAVSRSRFPGPTTRHDHANHVG
jgi:hypothetical protein